MCGLTGIIASKNEKVNEIDLKHMTDVIRHRGPDGYGYFFEKNIGFGHRRLAIIDLSEKGRQPMTYMDNYTIIYNGEIYNYIELKNELRNDGYVFYSNTDTEIIMASYDKWGVNCLHKFNGMWAFAIYDKKANNIFIARDRFGIKPLYYYKDNDHFIFASEIKAILAHPIVSSKPNIQYCRMFVEEGQKEYIKETAFESIYRFSHASYMLTNLDDIFQNDLELYEYWTIVPNCSDERFEVAKSHKHIKKYYEILKDAVRIRLRSDVKVGSALSGGIDSSTIVKLINECLTEENKNKNRQETFSSVYKTKDAEYCDESVFIDELTDYLNVKSNQVEPKIENFIEDHKKVAYYMDLPYDGSLMSAWNTYKLVSSTDVKVTLDGQGADEQLAGYLSYIKHSLTASKTPFKDYKNFKRLPIKRKILLQGLLLNIFFRTIPKKALYLIFRYLRKNLLIFDHLNKRLFSDTMTYLTKHLHYGDRLSMAHSIESRMPFMDYRFVEYAVSLPVSYKIHNCWTKYIARKAMEKKLPDNITWRKDKMGFPNPEDYWFRGKLKEWFCQEIESSQFLKDLGVGQDIRKRIESREHISSLVRLLNLLTWHKIFIEGDYSELAL